MIRYLILLLIIVIIATVLFLFPKNKDLRVKRFATFTVFSGLGALWLSLCYFYVVNNDGTSNLDTNYTFLYYLFNSLVLLYSAIQLKKLRLKHFAFLSILLFVSVSASLFIPISDSNLYYATVVTGMGAGFIFGGTILVPFFLISVYVSAYKAFLILTKKFNLQKSNSQDQNIASGENFTQNNSTQI